MSRKTSAPPGLCGFGIYKHPDYPGIIYVMNGDDKFELFEKMSKEKQDEIQNEIQKGIQNEIQKGIRKLPSVPWYIKMVSILCGFR